MEDPVPSLRTILWTFFAGIALYWIYRVFTNVYRKCAIRRSVKKHWPSRPSHWFWGHNDLVNMLRRNPEKLLEMIMSMSEDFKYGAGLYLGPLITLIRVGHKNIFRTILGGSEEKFPKSEAQYKALHPWLGSKGLLLLGGKDWQRHRHLLLNSFHFGIIRPYVVKMNECSAVLVNKWNSKISENGEEVTVEVFRDFSLMTIDAIMKCLMGVECNSQIDEGRHREYVSAIHDISSSITDRWRTDNLLLRIDLFYNLTSAGRKFVKCVKTARDYAESFIDLRRQEYEKGAPVGAKLGCDKNSKRHFDFLDVLLQARDPDGKSLSNKEVSDEVNTFIFEGHDTTTSAISWTCYCLSSNPACQEKCYKEILETVGFEKSPDLDDLGKLKYVTMCIKESLRLYPPVPSIARKPTCDLKINGMPIKKDSEVILSIISAHYDARNWPNPKTFDPSRFTQENIANRDPYSYVPFSAGLRNCIGQNFAMNEIKVCLVHLLRNFELMVDESKPPIPLVELIFRTKSGLHIRVKRREA